jgi:type IV pilus assembly protein PilA
MLLQKLRTRAGARLNGDSEAGFTLVELLVVMLILGLLAAIAIPSFFNQRDKAKDASGKEMARTAETAVETYATDNGGVYTGVTLAKVNGIEQTVSIDSTSTTNPYLSNVAAAGTGDKGYTLTVTVPSTGNTFSIARSATTGVTTFSCATTGKAGCPSDGDWAH